MNKSRFLIVILVLVILAGGVFFGWKQMAGLDEKAREAQEHEAAANAVGAIVISETGVATLHEVPVPFHSVFETDGVYSGIVNLPGASVTVSPGDTFSVGGADYFVYDIWCDQDDHCYFAIVGPQPDFHVAISVTNSEVSEDSNSTTETVTIDGYEGTYHWTDNDRDRAYSFTLNDEELHDLTLLVRENGLMTSREESVPADPWNTFEVTWSNSMGGQSASGQVTGSQTTPEDESKYAAEQVLNYVQDKFGPN